MTIQESLKSQSSKQWKLTQLARHETVNTRSKHYSPKVEGSIPSRGNFLLNLFCSDTILADQFRISPHRCNVILGIENCVKRGLFP